MTESSTGKEKLEEGGLEKGMVEGKLGERRGRGGREKKASQSTEEHLFLIPTGLALSDMNSSWDFLLLLVLVAY